MPSVKNMFNLLYVNLVFIAFGLGIYYLSSIQEIKANWPLYRCNPMYMGLSDNLEQDFSTCVQSMQSNYMGVLLQPLTFVTASITDSMSGFVEQINSVRGMFDKIRTLTSTIIQSVFGIFLNLIIELQKIIIGMKDLMGKTIGIVVALLYIMDGSIKTMNSTWNGPPGQMVRNIGKCFHPETSVKLKNGDTVQMKDLNLGDVLENSSVVESTMRINNATNVEPLYVLKGCGVGGSDIHVTGSHLILDAKSNTFVQVKNHDKSKITQLECDWFSCLITSDHKIKIGSEIFWDWEDHSLNLNGS
jgi:hypothetical protein